MLLKVRDYVMFLKIWEFILREIPTVTIDDWKDIGEFILRHLLDYSSCSIQWKDIGGIITL